MREDLKKIIEDNWEDIKELIIKKAEAEQKPKSIWDLKAKDGEEYYYISFYGGVCQGVFNTVRDEWVRSKGDAFLTREEAEFELERRKIEAIMKRYSRPFKYKKCNYHIEYHNDDETLDIGVYHHISVGIPYFESEEIAQKVINKIGEDRLIKYWFGVENDEKEKAVYVD